jgi:urease accessory protein
MIRFWSLLGLCLTGGSAFAHPGHEAGFIAGALHPLTGVDHLLALLAVGCWSSAAGASTPVERWWMAPLVFALSMSGCALLTRQLAWQVPAVELQIILSLLVLGALMLWQARLPGRTGLLLIAVLAVGHGAAHGQELSGPALPWLLGMLLATLALHLAGVLLGLLWRKRWAMGERLAGAGLLSFAGVTLWSLLA